MRMKGRVRRLRRLPLMATRSSRFRAGFVASALALGEMIKGTRMVWNGIL